MTFAPVFRPSVLASAAFVGVVALVPGCQLLLPETCPDLDEVCPDVQCEDRGGYVQNRDGCSTCECIDDGDPGPGAVCWDDSECGDGERCDTVNFCEPAPGCDPETAPNCPDACYGRCVAGTDACSSDADCAEGQVCAFFSNERPVEDQPDQGGGAAPPDGDGEERPGDPVVPVEQGVCIDVSCGSANVALPECPPGSELVFDPNIDPCNPVCISVDFCRELLPEECLQFPGCELVQEPCGCGTEPGQDPDAPNGGAPEPAPCDCAFIERCVAVDDCSSLPIEECELNPNCVLKAIGSGGGSGGSGGSDGGAPGAPEPAPCDPSVEPDCNIDPAPPPPPPEEQLICVARGADGFCFSDADCAFGEVCQLVTVCGSGCTVDPDTGEETCFEECWSEQGSCVPSDRSCFDLLPDECLADPRCELVDGGNNGGACFCDETDPNCQPCDVPTAVCQPRDGTCFGDFDCLPEQHCELVETCPPCDPSTGNDLDCLAPCFVEGRCVDGAPPPVNCQSDFDCFTGEACVAVTVCETCDGSTPDGGAGGGGGAEPIPPPPCDPVCRDESVCVQVDPICFSDVDCGAGAFCDFSQLQCGAQPGGLVAQCPGLCVEVQTPCAVDTDCAAGQRCAVEAAQPVCVDDNTAGDGQLCGSDQDCVGADGTAATCRFASNFCLDDPNTDVIECLGWCAGACAEVETPAVDPASGQCEVFPDSCIPPGWQRADACAP